jgi:hypothetical protein
MKALRSFRSVITSGAGLILAAYVLLERGSLTDGR